MSHRITFDSKIKDRDLAISALKSLGYAYTEASPNVLRITSGPLARATVNLDTGIVESDSDYHSRDQLGGLRQAYSEADVRRSILRQGASIESRQQDSQTKVIKLRVRMTG